MARLPEVGGDKGNWGDILNDYLSQAHEADGTLKPVPQSKVQDLVADLGSKANTADLGTAAASDAVDFATAAQGAKADVAVPVVTKGQANGVATLDGDAKLSESQVPTRLGEDELRAMIEDSTESRFGVSNQRGAIRLTSGGSSTDISSGIQVLTARIPFRLPVKPKRMRVHVRNARTTNTESVIPGAIAFDGVSVGISVLDSAGAPTSQFESAPTQLMGAFSTSVDGVAETIGSWVDVSVPAQADLLLSFRVTGYPSNQVRAVSASRMWWSSVAPDFNALVMPSPSLTNGWFDWWLEYEFEDVTPHCLFIGDSLTSGTGSTWPFRDGYAIQAALRNGVAATNASSHGSNLQNWLVGNAMKWEQIHAITKPRLIDLGIGSNDINSGRTLAQVQADYGALLTLLRAAHPGIPIVARTILPRNFTTTPETVRVAFNAWIKTRPFNLAGVLDIVPPVVDPTDSTKLIATLTTDTIHLTTEGYRLIAERFQAPFGA